MALDLRRLYQEPHRAKERQGHFLGSVPLAISSSPGGYSWVNVHIFSSDSDKCSLEWWLGTLSGTRTGSSNLGCSLNAAAEAECGRTRESPLSREKAHYGTLAACGGSSNKRLARLGCSWACGAMDEGRSQEQTQPGTAHYTRA